MEIARSVWKPSPWLVGSSSWPPSFSQASWTASLMTSWQFGGQPVWQQVPCKSVIRWWVEETGTHLTQLIQRGDSPELPLYTALSPFCGYTDWEIRRRKVRGYKSHSNHSGPHSAPSQPRLHSRAHPWILLSPQLWALGSIPVNDL